jgi:hypothetical protein
VVQFLLGTAIIFLTERQLGRLAERQMGGCMDKIKYVWVNSRQGVVM